MNIHDDAEQFIPLILGLCTTNETTLGLDDSVQWTTNSSGRKIGGTLKTIGPSYTVVTYDLIMDELPFVRTGVRGRGTTCWSVKNSPGDRFIVKDYWIAGDGTSEYELLAEAHGLPGVCQMVSYESNRAQTKDFRGSTQVSGDTLSRNRRAIRIVMKAYGPSIERFSCVEGVLGALRDAIAAHRALLSRDIIHRDISPNNILHGPPAAEEGDRGVLIDLDIAFRCHQLIAENRADFNTGTRMFQSLIVLKTWELEQNEISAQDYLGDLEASFRVFSNLLLAYKANGNRTTENWIRKQVLSWHHTPIIAYAVKHTFLYCRRIAKSAEEHMDEGRRHACLDLFFNFRDYMGKLAMEKEDILLKQQDEPETGGAFPNTFSSILENVDERYNYVLGLFDAASKKAKQVPETSQSQDKGTAAPSSASTASIDTPLPATATAKDIPAAPSTTELPPSRSDQSTLTTPCDVTTSIPLTQSTSSGSRSSKRCSEEAGLDKPPADVKRTCPPDSDSTLFKWLEPASDKSALLPKLQVLELFNIKRECTHILDIYAFVASRRLFGEFNVPGMEETVALKELKMSIIEKKSSNNKSRAKEEVEIGASRANDILRLVYGVDVDVRLVREGED